ncbi:MAG TPA: hypothetical protein VKQ11_03620 [Candidatus Sulfotelmatobacter sp.]|nr:hypothetical protein [Candidatus Sulfotelmatobacter sp.]
MRFVKLLGVLLFAFAVVAMAGENKLGVREVNHVKFDATIRVGTTVMPAGEYVVRHTMQGEEHVMVFRHEQTRDEFKVKCTLVPLTQKAEQTHTVYTVNAANERVLQEMVFRGDTAKHVF